MGRKSSAKRKKTEGRLEITTREQAEYVSPGVETVEAIDAEDVSKSLSPSKLASLVAESKKGNGLALATLALEMREEDAAFGGNLRTRKLAVINQPCNLIEGENEKANELIQKFKGKRYFTKLLYCLLEAVEVGYAVLRLVWDATSEGYWLPVAVHRIDPRRVGFDPNTEQFFWRNFDDTDDRSKIIDGDGLEYLVYAPPDILMPQRGGLARLAAYAFMAKRFGLGDWVKYLSSAGMPVRVGKYEPRANTEERLLLKRALRMISIDKAAAIPKNTSIEFVEAQNSGGASFKALAEYLDKQIAVAVLGQTLTSGSGQQGSYALGHVHNEVRQDILKADCVSITAEIQELVDKICLVNFGPDSAPALSIKPKAQKDLQKMAGVVSTLTQHGLEVPLKWIYEEFGIPEPKDGEETLGSAEGQAKDSLKDSKKPKDSEKDKKGEMNSLDLSQQAYNSELNSYVVPGEKDPDAELEQLEAQAMEFDYHTNAEDAVLKALSSSKDFNQFNSKMAKIALEEPEAGLVQSLALATTKGALLGQRDGDA